MEPLPRQNLLVTTIKCMQNKRPALLLFDVNETLLDLSELQSEINNAFKNELAFKLWFSQMLHYSLVETTTQQYRSFSEIGKASLQMMCTMLGQELTNKEQEELLQLINQAKPHSDVEPGLKKLKEAGYKMVTLTNSPLAKGVAHLQKVGLDQYFEAMLSVESVQLFKPNAAPYLFAVQEMGLKIDNVMMVAAHGWDMVGAQRAGARTAFIARSNQALYPLAHEPELSAPSLSELADKLIALE